MRFPGYIGESYEDGGVLFIAMVHNANQLFKGTFRKAEAATNEWRERGRSPATDSAYLDGVREGYIGAMTSWGPWMSHFDCIIKTLKLNLDQIAYTNVAKCWSVPREVGHEGRDMRLMRACKIDFPIATLVGHIEPKQVYVWSANASNAVGKNWGIDPNRVWGFTADRGALIDHGSEPIRDWPNWLDAAARQYQSL